MYIPKYFALYEIVPEEIYHRNKSQAWQFFDDRALKTLDALREKYGKMIVNDWFWGGVNDSRGFRTPDDLDGAELSPHKRGQAFDVSFDKYPAQKVRDDILENQDEFPYINAIEDDVTWLHFDTRNCKRIMVFKPRV